MAPEPLVPDQSVPLNATTVIDAAVAWPNVAVTVTLLNAVVAKARQISASPACPFARLTRAHVNPAPLTPVTVWPPAVTESAEIKANNNSLGRAVEKDEVVTPGLAMVLSPQTTLSIANWLDEVVFTTRVALTAWFKLPLVPEIVSG